MADFDEADYLELLFNCEDLDMPPFEDMDMKTRFDTFKFTSPESSTSPDSVNSLRHSVDSEMTPIERETQEQREQYRKRSVARFIEKRRAQLNRAKFGDDVDSPRESSVFPAFDSIEEKKQKRLIRNRLSAQQHRERRRQYTQELESKMELLQRQNYELQTAVQQLRQQNNKLLESNTQLQKQLQEARTLIPVPFLVQNELERVWDVALNDAINEPHSTGEPSRKRKREPPKLAKKAGIMFAMMFSFSICINMVQPGDSNTNPNDLSRVGRVLNSVDDPPLHSEDEIVGKELVLKYPEFTSQLSKESQEKFVQAMHNSARIIAKAVEEAQIENVDTDNAHLEPGSSIRRQRDKQSIDSNTRTSTAISLTPTKTLPSYIFCPNGFGSVQTKQVIKTEPLRNRARTNSTMDEVEKEMEDSNSDSPIVSSDRALAIPASQGLDSSSDYFVLFIPSKSVTNLVHTIHDINDDQESWLEIGCRMVNVRKIGSPLKSN